MTDEPAADSGPDCDDGMDMDDIGSDVDPDSDEGEDILQPHEMFQCMLEDEPKSPMTPAHASFDIFDSQNLSPGHEDDEKVPLSQPESPMHSPKVDSKNLEMVKEDKCVVIDDTPEKATTMTADELNMEILRIQKALASAKREQMAQTVSFELDKAILYLQL